MAIEHCVGYHVWLCFLLAFFHVPSHGIGGGLNWRLTLASAMIPAIFVMIQIPFCPESPRWLMGKDRYMEAYEATVQIRPHKILACRDMFYQHILMMEEESLQLPFSQEVAGNGYR